MSLDGRIFLETAKLYINLGASSNIQNRRFRAVFGAPPQVADISLRLIRDKLPHGRTYRHLLWGLHFLKSYNTEHNNCLMFNVDEKTFRKWSWFVILELESMNHVSPIIYPTKANSINFITLRITNLLLHQTRLSGPIGYTTSLSTWGRRRYMCL